MNDTKQSETYKDMEAEIEGIIEIFIRLAGVAAVKSLLVMMQRQALAAADLHEGLAWASGVLKGASQFVDKKPQ